MATINEQLPEDLSRNDAGQKFTRELRNLRSDLATLVASLQRYGAIGAEKLKGRAKDLTDDPLSDWLKAVRDMRQQVDTPQQQLQGDLSAHPLAWLVGAPGPGMLISLLFLYRD